jgi:cytochrome c oxidase subunit 2
LSAWVLQPPTVVNFMSEFNLFLVLGVGAAALTLGWMVYAAVKYRARNTSEHEEMKPSGRNDNLRAWLTAVITIGILAVALITAVQATQFLYNAPSGPDMVIRVYGFQWGWNFTYPNGYSDIGLLRVPANTTIILNITSKDVFHTLGIPSFYVKGDAIPGQWTSLWFKATQTGNYTIRCYELCGIGHYGMVATLMVMPQSQFEAWYSSVSKGGS